MNENETRCGIMTQKQEENGIIVFGCLVSALIILGICSLINKTPSVQGKYGEGKMPSSQEIKEKL